MQSESHNMSLFEMNASNPINEKHSKLFAQIVEIDPDKLTPREALDVLYKLKENS